MRKLISKLRIYNFFWKPETNPKNEETDPDQFDQQTENLKLFFKLETDPKKRGNGPKKKRKPINKLRIYNFFSKPETNPKKEETDQQSENLQLFLKIGNGPKKKRKPTQKKRGNRSTNWEFKTFSENRKRAQKMRKRIENSGKSLNNIRPW